MRHAFLYTALLLCAVTAHAQSTAPFHRAPLLEGTLLWSTYHETPAGQGLSGVYLAVGLRSETPLTPRTHLLLEVAGGGPSWLTGGTSAPDVSEIDRFTGAAGLRYRLSASSLACPGPSACHETAVTGRLRAVKHWDTRGTYRAQFLELGLLQRHRRGALIGEVAYLLVPLSRVTGASAFGLHRLDAATPILGFNVAVGAVLYRSFTLLLTAEATDYSISGQVAPLGLVRLALPRSLGVKVRTAL